MTLTHKATAIAVAATLAVSGSGLAAVAAGTNMERANADDTTVSAEATPTESASDACNTADSSIVSVTHGYNGGGTGKLGPLDGKLCVTDAGGHKQYTYDYTYDYTGGTLLDERNEWMLTTVSAFGKSVTLDPFKDAKIDFDSQSAKDALERFNNGETVKAEDFPAIMTATLTSDTGDTLTANIRITGRRFVKDALIIGAPSVTGYYSNGEWAGGQQKFYMTGTDAPVDEDVIVKAVDKANGTITMTGGSGSFMTQRPMWEGGPDGRAKLDHVDIEWSAYNPNAKIPGRSVDGTGDYRIHTYKTSVSVSDLTYDHDEVDKYNSEVLRHYKSKAFAAPAAETAEGYSYTYGPYAYDVPDVKADVVTKTRYTADGMGEAMSLTWGPKKDDTTGQITLTGTKGAYVKKPDGTYGTELTGKPDATLTITAMLDDTYQGTAANMSTYITDTVTLTGTDTGKGTVKYERAADTDTSPDKPAWPAISIEEKYADDAGSSDTPSDPAPSDPAPSDPAPSDPAPSDPSTGTGDTDDTVTATSQAYGTLDGTLTSDTGTDGHKHYTYEYTYDDSTTDWRQDAKHGWDTTVSAFGQNVALDPFKDAKIDFDSQSAKDALAKLDKGETVTPKEFPVVMTATLSDGKGDTLTANIRISGQRYMAVLNGNATASLKYGYTGGSPSTTAIGWVVKSADKENGTITMTDGGTDPSPLELYKPTGKLTNVTGRWVQFNPNADGEQRFRTVTNNVDTSTPAYDHDETGKGGNNTLRRYYTLGTLTAPAADTADGYSYAYGPYSYAAQDRSVKAYEDTTYETSVDGLAPNVNRDPQTGRTTITGKVSRDGKPDSAITVTGKLGNTDTTESVTLPGTSDETTTSTQLGQVRHTGTATYRRAADPGTDTSPDKLTWPAIDLEQDYEYTDGDAITLKDGTAFTRDSDGTWKATAANATLGNDNKPDTQSVTLSNGDTAPIAWDAQPTVVEKTVNDKTGTHTVRFVTLKGTATGTVTVHGVTQSYTVNVTADRQEDTHFTITGVRETKADGTTADTPITFDTGTQSYEVTLPYSELTGAYSLLTDSGPDATVGDATQTLGDGASRIITVEANGTRYTVTVRFAAADIQPDSPAKLEGIYVNKTGEHTKGALIDGWDPNRLDYTLTVGENDPSPYILPVAGDGVTVSAGDVEQTADAAKQSWTVTDKASGASRTYTVTVLRSHSWKTAVEQFTPPTVDARPQTVAPDSDSDATLVSHGWTDKDGEYHAEDADEYTVDEGGAFAYEAKKGQSVSVSVARKGGMTFEYTVTVLPVDTSLPPAQYVYTVTFLTAATHSAQLTGIAVDGVEIPGFSPDTTSYEVQVNDPDEWTVAPLYDRTTGMSVKTSKEGDTATITVTSGDGLVQTAYTVHVTRKPLAALSGAQGTVGVGGELAQTGAGVLGVVVASLAALLGGVGVSLVAWLRKRRYSVNRDGTARG
ncbi:hypothetical protein ACLUWO_05165 [Pseudoscardovia radai]|uniref:hypothetical protein n=1 Tax=Pseudoscardovia radai TaxID=987066 RepID=UPI00399598CF